MIRGQTADRAVFERLNAPKLEIPGAKIATEDQARRTAFQAFVTAKLKTSGVSATESAQVDSIVTLGFDLQGFGRKGDKVWQVSVRDMASRGGGVTAILWIHPESRATRFLISRWQYE